MKQYKVKFTDDTYMYTPKGGEKFYRDYIKLVDWWLKPGNQKRFIKKNFKVHNTSQINNIRVELDKAFRIFISYYEVRLLPTLVENPDTTIKQVLSKFVVYEDIVMWFMEPNNGERFVPTIASIAELLNMFHFNLWKTVNGYKLYIKPIKTVFD